MFHILIRVEVRRLKKYLRFILKMPNCGAADSSASKKNINIYICDEKPSISLQNMKKTCRGVFFFKKL